MKMVIYPAVEEPRLARIIDAAGPMTVVNARDSNEAVLHVRDADAFFGRISAEMLAAAERLRWVQSPTASLEHYLFPALVDHPCTLTNMRGLFHDVVADHVFALVLCFARNLHRYLDQQRRRQWSPIGGDQVVPNFAAGGGIETGIDRAHTHLSDSTMGIVGLGSIGSEVARRAAAFGMRVVAVDPVRDTAQAEVERLWKPDRLDDLLAASDFVVITAPHTPRTAAMFGAEQFRRMKTTSVLINVGRGAIVRLDDLVAALRHGEIAGAGLDVFETEPLPEDHPLWEMDCVVITPHIAAASVHVSRRHLETLLENIRHFVAGEPLKNVADKREWF